MYGALPLIDPEQVSTTMCNDIVEPLSPHNSKRTKNLTFNVVLVLITVTTLLLLFATVNHIGYELFETSKTESPLLHRAL